jgi:hypothetical protein
MTATARLARVHSLAADLAAEVQAIAEEQTLAEHIRDRAAWTGLELDARRLSAGVAAMVERKRSLEPGLFEGVEA